MKQISFFLILFSLISCKKDKEESLTFELSGKWEQTFDIFPVPTGKLAMCFSSCANDAYYVGGTYYTLNPDSSTVFFKFTPTWGWQILSPFPGRKRTGATIFGLNEKIYVGLGRSNFFHHWELLNDFWEYDPNTDRWDSLPAPFPGKGREYAISFVCDGKAYVGTGIGEYAYGDFYSFTPDGCWKQEIDMSISPRWSAVSFQLDKQTYIAMGYENTVPKGSKFLGVEKFSKFDKKWEKMKTLNPIEFPDFAIGKGSAIVLNEFGKDFGYVIGENSNESRRYDPRKDKWYKVNNMQSYALYFTLNNILYGVQGINTYKLTY